MFYAAWCSHCKDMMPAWEELSRLVEEMPFLVIAKLDLEANELPFDTSFVEHYPTLRFYSKTDKVGFNYDGHRRIEDFTSFLE